jgi:activator of HSP90 ATPase
VGNEFALSAVIPAKPQAIYQAWLSSDGHAAMTGSPARVEGGVGGIFTAWDGYISGKTLELEADRRIVLAWRTTEFPDGSPDSKVEILLEPVNGDTKVTLLHSQIPDGQTEDYRRGWEEFYFTPMRAYFSGQGPG